MFLCDNQWGLWQFWRFSVLSNMFSRKRKTSKNWSTIFESTKIVNASFPYKTAISKANVKTNRMMTTKWTYHKNGVLPVTTLFFWKFCFSLRTSYEELICCTKNPNAHICTFWKRWSFIWRYFFLVSILNRIWSFTTTPKCLIRDVEIGLY